MFIKTMRLLLLLLFSAQLFAATNKTDATNPETTSSEIKGDVLAETLAVVGNIPITSFDLEKELDFINQSKAFKKDKRNLKSQVLDILISRAVIDHIAEQESITMSYKRVDEFIEKDMQNRGITSMKKYEKILIKVMQMDLQQFRRQKFRELKTEQVMQLRVSIPSPTPSQIQEWYKLNKKKFGLKLLVRIIRKRFDRNDIQQELKVSKEMKAAYKIAKRNFSKAAKKYSDHHSKNRGGLLPWMQGYDLVKKHGNMVAGIAFQRLKPGQVSPTFIDNGAYYIVKLEAKKAPSLDEVYDQIRSVLYVQNRQAALAQWVKGQRKRISVNVFLKDYQEL